MDKSYMNEFVFLATMYILINIDTLKELSEEPLNYACHTY